MNFEPRLVKNRLKVVIFEKKNWTKKTHFLNSTFWGLYAVYGMYAILVLQNLGIISSFSTIHAWLPAFFPPSNFGYAPRLAKNCLQRIFLKRRLESKFRKFWCHDKMAHKISFAIDLITSKWPKITPKTIYTKMAQGEGTILNLSRGEKKE